jgi:hypothetical protein
MHYILHDRYDGGIQNQTVQTPNSFVAPCYIAMSNYMFRPRDRHWPWHSLDLLFRDRPAGNYVQDAVSVFRSAGGGLAAMTALASVERPAPWRSASVTAQELR